MSTQHGPPEVAPSGRSLFDLEFVNRFTAELPGDPESENRRREVKGALFSRVAPTPTAGPKLVAASPECATRIGLDPADLSGEDFARVFSGNALLPGMDPYAMTYGGHQFGHWAGQLGDGRAINLGEVVAPDGSGWTLQLKGAGPTPYSRTADGLAVLRSSVREFICSEAMFHLGVPTTRALSLIETGDRVLRDMFYDGNEKLEPGAVVCRVARSFVRFGSFELPASRGDVELIAKLADHVIRTGYPELLSGDASAPIDRSTYLSWFQELTKRTAHMVAHWTRVGFVHGVMNTDNMSILGETIDYGPYGWLEDYDPDWTPNTTDAGGKRYRFGHQSAVAHWNLTRLASALVPLFDGETEALQEAVNAYPKLYADEWGRQLAQKLGFETFVEDTDAPLAVELFRVLGLAETDMTIFFRRLSEVEADAAPLDEAYYEPEKVSAEARDARDAWLRDYRARLAQDNATSEDRRARMNSVNPIYVPRNYLAQLAIDEAEKGNHAPVVELLDVLRRPYEERAGLERYAEKRPEWARHRPGCSMLSCSS
ncbi:MAG: YdiU family protein [Planctomycetota bacterium]